MNDPMIWRGPDQPGAPQKSWSPVTADSWLRHCTRRYRELAGHGENWFLPPVLTGLSRLAETPSGRNWPKLAKTQMTKAVVILVSNNLFETYKCLSGCYWDIFYTLHHWFPGWLLLKKCCCPCFWILLEYASLSVRILHELCSPHNPLS